MVKEELAKTYAEENCTEYKNALQAAFEKGFEVGTKLAEEKRIVIDGVEYVDLGLPSGTLWSANPYSVESFPEANKLNLPTLEDWEEIAKYCEVTIATNKGYYTNSGCFNLSEYGKPHYDFSIHGLNGSTVSFERYNPLVHTWYQIPDSVPQKKVPAVSLIDLADGATCFKEDLFAGTKLQIMLVKRKDQ